MDMKKLGVVIFNRDYFSSEGLAALSWASTVFEDNKQSVKILLIDDKKLNPGENESTGTEIKNIIQLLSVVEDIARKRNLDDESINRASKTIEGYTKKFGKNVSFESLEETDLPETLKGAIKAYNLDTLVVGMAALGTYCKDGELQLMNSKCSVVLVSIKEGSGTPETTMFKIIPPQTNAGN